MTERPVVIRCHVNCGAGHRRLKCLIGIDFEAGIGHGRMRWPTLRMIPPAALDLASLFICFRDRYLLAVCWAAVSWAVPGALSEKLWRFWIRSGVSP
jgi:hypothetical protein